MVGVGLEHDHVAPASTTDVYRGLGMAHEAAQDAIQNGSPADEPPVALLQSLFIFDRFSLHRWFSCSQSLEIAVADDDEIADGAEEILGTDLGARNVGPAVQGELVDRVGKIRQPALGGVQPEKAGDDLDIENPAGRKRLLEDGTKMRSNTKQLRAALSVVNRERQDLGGAGSEEAPEVMPES